VLAGLPRHQPLAFAQSRAVALPEPGATPIAGPLAFAVSGTLARPVPVAVAVARALPAARPRRRLQRLQRRRLLLQDRGHRGLRQPI
jgi:hypothetical protein